jgi:tRNA pseudouridine13 synthase
LSRASGPDAAVGMDGYASVGAPCHATVKASEEDFQVEELVALEALGGLGQGGFPLYRVEKRSIDTMHMARELGVALRSRVSYAGLKDKKAVAVQFVTPASKKSARPQTVVRPRFTAELVGFLPRPMSRTSLRGNRFRVTLRDCCGEVADRVGEVFALAERRRLPNFYGHQRFGGPGGGTHIVGREIVGGRFEGAAEVMLTEPRPGDDQRAKAAREEMRRGNYRAGADALPASQDTERRVARRLADNPGDFVGALRAVDVRLRRLFVHAYQSYIFNRTVSLALAEGIDFSKYEHGDNWSSPPEGGGTTRIGGVNDPPPPGAVPMVQLVGYAYRDYGSRFDSLAEEVLKAEGVRARDFYVDEMPEVSAEGGFRLPHLSAAGLSCEVKGPVCVLGFTLGRGQYATVLLREVTKS